MVSVDFGTLLELRGALEALRNGDIEAALATFEPFVEQVELDFALRHLGVGGGS